jgi:AGCS family alanine or glycine:cation symporter
MRVGYVLLRLLNEFFTLSIIFPSILLLGIYLTWNLRCIQVSKIAMSFASLFKKKEKGAEGNISHYQAVSSVLAGNFGTGNISGMAIALATGGPGALIWMWIMAFFGAAIQYASCLLGVKYRKKNQNGEYVGGPMYYLRDGLGYRSLAVLFSICTIFGAFAVGNLAQVNSMVLPLAKLGCPPLVIGFVIAFFVALVILGGMQRMAKVSSAVVPMMALLYLGAAVIILILHRDQIPFACKEIFFSAFGSQESAMGGFLGFSVMQVLTTGFDRAIFATDAGTGIVPILQAATRTKNPVAVGIVSLVSPLMVMIVCTTTALVLITTGAYLHPSLASTNMVAYAFDFGIGEPFGTAIVVIALVLFGYTTALAWASCLERAVGFLLGRPFVRYFQFLYILLVPVGAILHVDFVWILADISLSCMVVMNLIGITGLTKEVVADSQDYFYTRRQHEIIQ